MAVVVLITQEGEASTLAPWGARFAQALGKKLVLLCAERGDKASRGEVISLADTEDPLPGPLPGPLAAAAVAAARSLPPAAAAGEDSSGGPPVEVRAVRHSDLIAGVLRELQECDARLLVLGRPQEAKARIPALQRGLFLHAPCETLILRPGGGSADRCCRILVPASGGPHSHRALRLARSWAADDRIKVTALYVESDADEISEEVGRRHLEEALVKAQMGGGGNVEGRVELAPSVAAGVARVAAEGFDLVLMGASRVGAVRSTLFGTVPSRMLAGEGGLTIGVLRAARPAASTWRSAWRSTLERWLDLRIPELEREDRVALVEELQSNSRWSFDFLALISLSTSIAALGLLQDSAAVVIGAMLVAPLMTPLLGAGLALVQGNLPLMRTASQSILLGFLAALGIGVVAGLLVPLPELSAQILARGQPPTLLDLGVAFLSGMAAAYCIGRPNLSAALPGVAIAAALVPPIATIGICLSLGAREHARGAALLFTVNVVAIILGAAVSYFGAGIRPNRKLDRANRWARTSLAALVLGLVLLSLPLGSVLISRLALRQEEGTVSPELRQTILARLAREPGVQLKDASFGLDASLGQGETPALLVIRVSSPQPLPRTLAAELAAAARELRQESVKVRLITDLEVEETATGDNPKTLPSGSPSP